MCFVEHDLKGAYNNWFVCNTNGICAVLRNSGFTNITRAGGDYSSVIRQMGTQDRRSVTL